MVKPKKIILLLSVLFCFCCNAIAQNWSNYENEYKYYMDSSNNDLAVKKAKQMLQYSLRLEKDSTIKISTCYKYIGNAYSSIHNDSAKFYYDKAIEYLKNHKKGNSIICAKIFYNKALVFYDEKNTHQAELCLINSLAILKNLNCRDFNLSNTFLNLYRKIAFQKHDDSLFVNILLEKEKLLLLNNLRYTKDYAEICQTIGAFYVRKELLSNAADYLNRSIFICDSINDTLSKAYAYNYFWLGNIYSRINALSKAETNYEKAILLLKKNNPDDTVSVRFCEDVLCDICILLEHDAKAAEYITKRRSRMIASGNFQLDKSNLFYDYSLAKYYFSIDSFCNAIPLFEENLEPNIENNQIDTTEIINIYSKLVLCYDKCGFYKKESKLLKKFLSIKIRNVSIDSMYKSKKDALLNLLVSSFQKKVHEQTERGFIQLITPIVKQLYGFKEDYSLELFLVIFHLDSLEQKNSINNEDYVLSYKKKAFLMHEIGGFSNENLINNYEITLNATERVFGKHSVLCADVLNDLSAIYSEIGLHEKSKFYLQQSIAMKEHILSDTSSSIIESYLNLVGEFNRGGNYKMAFVTLEKIRIILNKKHNDFTLKANYYKIRSEYYHYINDNLNREINLVEAYNTIILETDGIPYHPTLDILYGLVNFFDEISDDEKKMFYLDKLLSVSKSLGINNEYYLSGMAEVSRKINDDDTLSVKSIESFLSELGTNLSSKKKSEYNYYKIKHNLSTHYLPIKRIASLEEIIPNYKELFGEVNVNTLCLYRDIAVAYETLKQSDSAAFYYTKALQTFNGLTNSSKENYSCYKLLHDISVYYSKISNHCKSIYWLNKYLDYQNKDINQHYFFLDNNEQKQYLESKIVNLNSLLGEILLSKSCSSYVNNAYEVITGYKSLLLKNSIEINKQVKISANSESDSLQFKLQNLKQYQYLLEANGESQDKIDEVLLNIEEVKRKLLSVLNYKSNFFTTNEDSILTKLKKQDAIVEFVKISFTNDSLEYAAFILRKDSIPKLISVCSQKEIEALTKRNSTQSESEYIKQVYTLNGIKIHDLLWSKIQKNISGAKNIYISTVGVLNNLNFSVLLFDSTSSNLKNGYNIYNLECTNQIQNFSPQVNFDKAQIKSTIVFAGIDYDKTRKSSLSKHYLIDSISLTDSRGYNSRFSYLPGTLIEANEINNFSQKAGIQNKLFSGENASENNFKKISNYDKPFFLHIATHAYYIPFRENKNDFIKSNDTKSKSIKKLFKFNPDPMLRTGLVFSGANKTILDTNKVSNSIEDDGILTSFEISNLNLSNCKLVVLSACETGLGDVDTKSNEGVFGLERAFKLAGVKNIIVSLWKIPDLQTSEFMKTFYSFCFSGNSVHESFRNTQLEMSAKYPIYFWGGFKLIE
ncbi:MAG: hypothetical protein RL708_351 [Bacteroidota bacterium]|jgi:CHAT domain-containing protein